MYPVIIGSSVIMQYRHVTSAKLKDMGLIPVRDSDIQMAISLP